MKYKGSPINITWNGNHIFFFFLFFIIQKRKNLILNNITLYPNDWILHLIVHKKTRKMSHNHVLISGKVYHSYL